MVPVAAWEGSSLVPLFTETSVRMSDPDSEGQYRVINDWLRACVADHPDCRLSRAKSSSYLLPRRLIDVDGPLETVRLIETAGFDIEAEAYVARSYCWGKIDVTVPDDQGQCAPKTGDRLCSR